MRKATANWIASAKYDLATAEAMLLSGRFLYVIFMCHLSLEKMLKAVFVAATGKPAPRTHDLIYLVREAGLSLPADHLDFVGIINNASIPTRYPEDLDRLVAEYPRRTASSYLARTKRTLKWLGKHESLERK